MLLLIDDYLDKGLSKFKILTIKDTGDNEDIENLDSDSEDESSPNQTGPTSGAISPKSSDGNKRAKNKR